MLLSLAAIAFLSRALVLFSSVKASRRELGNEHAPAVVREALVSEEVSAEIAALEDPVLVMFVTPGYLEQLHSWLCNTARMGDVHARTALFATSTETLFAVRAWDFPVHVFLLGSGDDERVSGGEEMVYGDADRKHLVLRRQLLIEELLVRGVSLLLVDIDYVWLRNPFEDPRVVAAPDVDVVATHSKLGSFDSICACFLRLNANERTLAFWRASVRHLGVAVASSPANASVVEQPSIEAAFLAHRYAHGLTATFLPLKDYVTGQIFWSSFFDEYGHSAVRPYLVHNNWFQRSVSHFTSKAHRAKFYGLWFLGKDGECDARRVADVLEGGRPIACERQLVDSRMSLMPLSTSIPLPPSFRDPCIDDFGFGSRLTVQRDTDRAADAAGVNETLSWMRFINYRQFCAMRDASCNEIAAPVFAASLARGDRTGITNTGAHWRQLVSLLIDRAIPTSRVLSYEPGKEWGRSAALCAAHSPLCYLQPLGRCDATGNSTLAGVARLTSDSQRDLRMATWTDARGESRAQAGVLRDDTPPAVAAPPDVVPGDPRSGRRAAVAAATLFALQPTAAVASRIDEVRAELGLRHPYLAMHVQRGETGNLNVSEYMAVASAFKERYGVSTAFVMTPYPWVVRKLRQYESAGWHFVVFGDSTHSPSGLRKSSHPGGGAVNALIELYLSAHADYWIGTLVGDFGVLTLLLQHGLYGRVGPYYALDRPETSVFADEAGLPQHNQFLSGQTFDCIRYYDRVRLPVCAGDQEQFDGLALV